MMTKKVNIYPARPIITVNPPIRNVVRDVTKPLADIRACLIAMATVEEILPTGGVVNLDLNNYDKDNTVKEEPVIEPAPVVVEEPVKVEVPVVEPVVEEPKEEEELTIALSDAVFVEDKVDPIFNQEETEPEQQVEKEEPVIEPAKRPQQYQNNKNNKKKR